VIENAGSLRFAVEPCPQQSSLFGIRELLQKNDLDGDLAADGGITW
jgi:hypothetical protein